MNLLLVAERLGEYRWPAGTREYDFLRRLGGEKVRVGVEGGPRGIARLLFSGGDEVVLGDLRWEPESRAPRAAPLRLWVGLPRPSDARRVLWHAGSFGVAGVGFLLLARTPPGYARSGTLGEAPTFLREGAEQGFHTRVPEFLGVGTLAEWCASGRAEEAVGLDPYRGEKLLGEEPEPTNAASKELLFGGERGFTPEELDWLSAAGVIWRHLGGAILRSEAAVVAGLTLALRAQGHLDHARAAQLEG
jgi:RsmE family RNA methyltransferase